MAGVDFKNIAKGARCAASLTEAEVDSRSPQEWGGLSSAAPRSQVTTVNDTTGTAGRASMPGRKRGRGDGCKEEVGTAAKANSAPVRGVNCSVGSLSSPLTMVAGPSPKDRVSDPHSQPPGALYRVQVSRWNTSGKQWTGKPWSMVMEARCLTIGGWLYLCGSEGPPSAR